MNRSRDMEERCEKVTSVHQRSILLDRAHIFLASPARDSSSRWQHIGAAFVAFRAKTHELVLQIEELRKSADHINSEVTVREARFDQSDESIVFVQGALMLFDHGDQEVAGPRAELSAVA